MVQNLLSGANLQKLEVGAQVSVAAMSLALGGRRSG
jgi:hypothetical protein